MPGPLAEAGCQRRLQCVRRGQRTAGKVVGRVENHFLVAHYEPQADGAMIAILRHGGDSDAPHDAVLGGGGSAGDGRGFTLIDRRHLLVRDVDGQPPPVAFEEIREDLDPEIADIDAVGARERADDERGPGRRQRHGAVLQDEDPVADHKIGCRRGRLCGPPTGCQEQQEQNGFKHWPSKIVLGRILTK